MELAAQVKKAARLDEMDGLEVMVGKAEECLATSELVASVAVVRVGGVAKVGAPLLRKAGGVVREGAVLEVGVVAGYVGEKGVEAKRE